MTLAPAPSGGLRRLVADDLGATAIEYALLAAMMAILAIAGLQALSGGTSGLYATLEAIALAIQVALAN